MSKVWKKGDIAVIAKDLSPLLKEGDVVEVGNVLNAPSVALSNQTMGHDPVTMLSVVGMTGTHWLPSTALRAYVPSPTVVEVLY